MGVLWTIGTRFLWGGDNSDVTEYAPSLTNIFYCVLFGVDYFHIPYELFSA